MSLVSIETAKLHSQRAHLRRITLEVDVESIAARDSLALAGAGLCVVAVQSSVPHVSIGRVGARKVLEGLDEAGRSLSAVGSSGKVGISQEGLRGIGAWDEASAKGLGSAVAALLGRQAVLHGTLGDRG